LSETEIEEITTTLRDQLAEGIAPAESINVEEVGKVITRAVEAINGINPKNPQSATLATAPAGWKFAVEEGAVALAIDVVSTPACLIAEVELAMLGKPLRNLRDVVWLVGDDAKEPHRAVSPVFGS
jgi:hypothetical protein